MKKLYTVEVPVEVNNSLLSWIDARCETEEKAIELVKAAVDNGADFDLSERMLEALMNDGVELRYRWDQATVSLVAEEE